MPAMTYDGPETLAAPQEEQQYHQMKAQLHERLISGLNLTAVRTVNPEWLRKELRRGAEELCRSYGRLLSQTERDQLVEELIYETLGLGPLEPLMQDPTVSDILINGPGTVYVERHGKLELTDIQFRDLDHLLGIVQRIVGRMGR